MPADRGLADIIDVRSGDGAPGAALGLEQEGGGAPGGGAEVIREPGVGVLATFVDTQGNAVHVGADFHHIGAVILQGFGGAAEELGAVNTRGVVPGGIELVAVE